MAVLILRECIIVISTVTLGTECRTTFVNQVSILSFVTLSCLTSQRTQTFDRFSYYKVGYVNGRRSAGLQRVLAKLWIMCPIIYEPVKIG